MLAGLCVGLSCAYANLVGGAKTGTGDGDAGADLAKLVTEQGLVLQELPVTTADGYECIMHRVVDESRTAPSRGPVLLQHGILDSSDTWCLSGASSLAFVLAWQGFDVFMGNSRGNKYCRAHKTLTVADHAFWQFSWDEMATHDVPAFVDTALAHTGQDSLVMYVGHSQGTTQMFARLVHDRAMVAKVPLFVALAPVAYIGHTGSLLLKALAGLRVDWMLEPILEMMGEDEFLPSTELFKWLLPVVCINPLTSYLCTSVMWLLAGYDAAEMNTERMDTFMAHFPSGTSVQNMYHWAQNVRGFDASTATGARGDFRAYDWGSEAANRAKYNHSVAPIYNLSHYPTHRHRLFMFAGGRDLLANTQDVARLLTDLPGDCTVLHDGIGTPSQQCSVRRLEKYDHLDFVWGRKAKDDVYLDVVNLAREAAGDEALETWPSHAVGSGGAGPVPPAVWAVCGVAGAAAVVGAALRLRSRRVLPGGRARSSSRVYVVAESRERMMVRD